ncbi:MAG: HIT family protein [Candidatus Competibacteraceae bacterium]|nr:HIT family protein [Candidatus Competibacteraceae bacterium]MBK7984297.1 HIT family protein [Candidatus Competibacteraceae bacterium]MBK8896264.1 HIT family protein [Candidatus Competibacteraceae bacterium]MBK8964926.1 HIT family protein [Candidatus Competibacteraceae bacterium]MBK9950207.1 HIT family protein [Candidatus Competibacteraceae bacterium]
MSACPFCSPPPARLVGQTARVLAISAEWSVSPGHTLLLPRRHVVSVADLNIVEWVELGQLLTEIRALLLAKLQPEGFSIGIEERAAAQTVKHLHLHLIPRYHGDQADPRDGIRWISPDKARHGP